MGSHHRFSSGASQCGNRMVIRAFTCLVTGRTVTNIGHDMFCEGLSMDADGGIVAAGGNSDYGTSIYDSPSDSWSDGGVSWLLPPLIPLISQFREFPSNVRL